MNALVSCHVKQIRLVKYVLIKQITDLPFVGHFGFRSLIFSPCLVDGSLADCGVGALYVHIQNISSILSFFLDNFYLVTCCWPIIANQWFRFIQMSSLA